MSRWAFRFGNREESGEKMAGSWRRFSLALNEDPLRIITLTPSALLKRKGKREREWDEVSISDAATANQQGGICILLIDLGWAARDAGTLGQH